MAATTKYLLAEAVMTLLKGGNPSAPTTIKMPVIVKMLEQLINRELKTEFFTVQSPSGETIPEGLVLATYESIAVEKYKADFSRAKLPAIPINLPRGMGVYFVGPHVSNLYLEVGSLTATTVSAVKITLEWEEVLNASGYYVERATDAAFSEDLTPIYTGSNLTFDDTGLTPGTNYYYRARATADGYNDGPFATASATTGSKVQLSTPVLTTPTVTSSAITCNWEEVDNAERYVLERATDEAFSENLKTIYFGSDLEFEDTGLTDETTYYYRLLAIGDGYDDSEYGIDFNTTES